MRFSTSVKATNMYYFEPTVVLESPLVVKGRSAVGSPYMNNLRAGIEDWP